MQRIFLYGNSGTQKSESLTAMQDNKDYFALQLQG